MANRLSARKISIPAGLIAIAMLSAFDHVHAEAPDTSGDVTLGLGALDMPVYPGSEATRVRALPVINLRYGRFFLGGDSSGGQGALGVDLYRDSHWRFGLDASYSFYEPREESYDSHLRGLPDINSTPCAGAFAAYRSDWIAVTAGVNTDVGGKHQGTLASLDANAQHRFGEHVTLFAGPGITWANGRYTQTFFGISTAQSLSSGVPTYTAGSGVNTVRLGVGGNYRFGAHWSLGGQFSVSHLQGDAVDSPITERRSQNLIAAFLSYHF